MFNFGDNLRNIRKTKGYTQKQVAAMINVTERNYQRYELNEQKPGFDVLVSLSRCFNMSIDYIVGISDVPSLKNNQYDNKFSKKEYDFFNRYKNLPDDYKKIMLDKLVELEEHEIVRQLLKEREKAGIMIAKDGKAMIPPKLTEKEEKLLFKQFQEFLNRNK